MVDVSKIRERFDELSTPILKSGRLYQLASFTQHGTTSTLDHVIAVAYSSLAFAMNAGIKVDEHALVRGALLHDYYLYDWHDHEAAPDNWHGFTHPRHALDNAREDFPDLTPVEEDIILHHMFPLVPIPPHTKEAWIVTTCDKACSTAETLTGNPYKRRASAQRVSRHLKAIFRAQQTVSQMSLTTTWITETSRERYD